MSKITRLTHKIFGRLADFGYQMGKFGSFKNGAPSYAADASEIQSLSNFEEGLYGALVGDGAPCKQDINAALHHSSRQLGYLFQQGIAEWETLTVYFIGSICSYDGGIYKSLVDNNTGSTPSENSANWEVIYGQKKTFQTPIVSGSFFVYAAAENFANAAGTLVRNSKVYQIGGSVSGFASINQVAILDIDPTTNALSVNQYQNGIMATAVTGPEIVYHKGYVYALGGGAGTPANGTTTTQRATINPDGTLSSFSATGALATAVRSASAFIHGGYVYLCGGVNSIGAISTVVQRAALNNDGSIGAWANYASAPLASDVQIGKCVVIGKRVYFIGEKIQYATLNDDGSIEGWGNSGNVGGEALNECGLFVLGDYVHIYGSGATQFKIKKAKINQDHTIGTFDSYALYTNGGAAFYRYSAIPTGKRVAFLGHDGATNLWIETAEFVSYDYLDRDNSSDPTKPQAGISDGGVISSQSTFQKLGYAPWTYNP